MRRSKKQEIVSRILVSSSVFILGSPIFTQALFSIPASAASISTTAAEETMLTAGELLPEQQEVEKVVEETVGTESEAIESEEQATAEEFAATKTESEEDAEKNSSEASTDSTAATEEKKAALADNILWSGMWGPAPATLDIEGVLTVGEGTLTTTVDQVIPIAEVSSNMTIRKVVLTAPVVLPADVPGLFESTGHYGKVPSELDEIVNLHLLDTSQATTMNSMFYGFRGTSLDLSNFDSTNVIKALGAGMNQFLANARYLKEIRPGEKFSFVGWNNWPGNEYPVNLTNPSGMIGFSSSYYTGYWQNVGSGTIDAPYGDQVFLSKELVLNYDGATMADTYVWQPRYIEGAPITVNYIDEEGKELLPPSIMTGGNIGDSYTITPKDIPGYILKEVQGDETGIVSKNPQTVTYVYSPKIETREESKIIARIIHYLYEDGSEAAPDHVDTIEFIRTVTINEATGETSYGDWEAKDNDTTFDAVVSPEIANYTPDKKGVAEMVDLTAESKDSEVTVTYKANMVESTETKEVQQTIHYLYEDGTEAAPDKVDTVTFTRTVTTNEATEETTYGEWQAKDDDTTFDAVTSPEIEHYTADKPTVEEVTGLTPESKDSEVGQDEQIKINRCLDMPVFKYIRHSYFSKKYICSSDEATIVTYFICLFLITVGGIPYEEIRLGLYTSKNPVFEITDEIMAAIQSIYKLKSNSTIKSSVFSLIAQVYYFHGVNYSIDKVTLNYYHNLFNNSFRNQFVLDIIENIIEPTKLFNHTKLKYLKKRLVFLIYMLSPKEEYQVRIAVLNMGSSILADASIYLLENELKGKQDVVLLPYTSDEPFDLLISNAYLPALGNNYSQFYQVTAIGADLEIKKIFTIIDQIAYSKYRSFVIK